MHIPSPCKTENGTLYFQSPGVLLLASTKTNLRPMHAFLGSFDNIEFSNYLEDEPLEHGAQICKAAGQLCYASFGEKRTLNSDAEKYFLNIINSGHHSVLEHANFTFLFYGISRSLTHEMVRHRIGMSYSMISQRYVDGKVLRFVERPEYQANPELHAQFENRIDTIAKDYDRTAQILIEESLSKGGSSGTKDRKTVNQAARSLLPNETEAPIIVTGNARAWRHFIDNRATEYAEVEIRNLAFGVFEELHTMEPLLFADYVVKETNNGSKILTKNRTFNKK